MKIICAWLVLLAQVVRALSLSQQDTSFLRVHDAVKLSRNPIIVTPNGLPPKVYVPAERKYPSKDQKNEAGHPGDQRKEQSQSGHGKEEDGTDALHKEEHHSSEESHTKKQAAVQDGAAEGEAGAHETKKVAKEEESLSLACLLMGGVGALMVVFHFANSTHLDIQLAAWRVLSMTVSIFAAVLLYGILKGLIIIVFEPSVTALTVMTLMLFVLLFLGSHAFLYTLKSASQVQVKGSGIILAHICGFAGMYGLADSREIAFVEEHGTPGMMALVLLSATCIGGLSYVMDILMKKVEDGESVIATRNGEGRTPREEDELWIDTCDEMDDDVFCLAVSFSIVLWFRYMIRGRPFPYMPGMCGNVTQHDAHLLLGCSIFFAVLVFVGAFAMHKFHHQVDAHRRIATNAQHLSSMIMAWCFLFWAEWQLYVWGWEHTIIGGCLLIAIFMTLFSFGAVILLNHIQGHFHSTKMMQRAMGSLEMALGVLVGFSWERAFDVGFEEINAKYEHGIFGPCLVILLSIGLFAVVAPAWRWNILPKVMKLEEKAKKRDSLAQQEKEASAQCMG